MRRVRAKVDRPRAARRARRRWIVGLGAIAVVAWVAVAAALLLSAAGEARTAKQELEAARDRFTADELLEGEGLATLDRAQARFARAESRVGALPLAPVRVLPVVGRQVRSLHALAGAGSDILAVAVDAAGDVEDLREGEQQPGERVAAVERLHATVVRSGERLAAVSLGPDEALLGPLADARSTLADELDEALGTLERAGAVTSALVDVLDGSRFLVLAANNAEMQNGWGMPLSAGVLEVVEGDLTLEQMEPTGELLLPADAVPVTGDLAAAWGFLRPTEDLRNLAVTASFDEAAPVAAAMWEALGRGPVDGVLVLDPLALRAILRTTGPVDAGGVVGADEVVPLVLHDAYVAQAQDLTGRDARRERQSEIAVAAVGAATAPGTDLVDLARNLAEAAENRHVMLWSADPDQQAAWVAAGVDGALQEDSLLVGAVNRAGNKLDWFLDAGAELRTTAAPGGTEVTVEVELVNRTPDGEPEYVAGPFRGGTGPLLAAGDWRGFLTAHVPGAATDVRIDGLDVVVDGWSGPTRIVSAVTLVPQGETRTHVIRFTMPPGTSSLVVEPSARVNPISWAAGEQRWLDDDGARSVSLGP